MENIVDKLTNYRCSLKEKIIGLKSKSISGANAISLSDASGSNAIAFGIKGNSIQNGEPTADTTIEIENVSGRNEFNITEFEANLVSSKILNDNGEEISDSTSSYSTYKIPVKANQNYYIKGAFQRIYFYDANENFINRSALNSGMDTEFTPTEDGFISLQIGIYYWAENKGKEQVVKGSKPAFYVPHNHIGFLNRWENLFNINGIVNVNYNGNTTSLNVVDGTELTTTVNSGSGHGYGQRIYVGKGNTFTVSAKLTRSGTTTTSTCGVLALHPEDGSSERTYVELRVGEKKSISGIAKTDYILVVFSAYTSRCTSATFDEIKVTYGTENNEIYKPYKENIVMFPLIEGQKLYKDTYLADDGIHHKRKQFKIGDFVAWFYSSASEYFYINKTDMKIIEEYGAIFSGLCTKYTPTTGTAHANWLNKPNNTIGIRPTTQYLCIKDTNYNNVDEFLTARANEIIEYELAEEEIVPYTEEQKEAYNKLKTLAMFKGVNNIEISSNIEVSETSIEYYSDEVVSLDNYKFEVKEI